MRFSKFAQNSLENDINVKQESVSPFLGVVSDKMRSPFLDLGIGGPIFLHPKLLKMAAGAKKWDFGFPNPKTKTTFCRQLSPKMVELNLVSSEYHFRASFGQILKIAYFRLIFG